MSKTKNLIRSLIQKIIFQPNIRNNIVRRYLEVTETREWFIHQIAMNETRQKAEFNQAPIKRLSKIQGFEDCYWLFSSNELNLGLSQLRFDDAAYLYQQLLCRNHPRVAEIGRYKGGTTFLLAAAGAEVLSLEIDPAVQDRYVPPLIRTLDHFGLGDKVDARLADAYSYDLGSNSFDFVLVHCSPPSYEHTRMLAERWWQAISVGGYLILHATPYLPGELKFIEEMSNSVEAWNAVIEPNTPGENVYFKKIGKL